MTIFVCVFLEGTARKQMLLATPALRFLIVIAGSEFPRPLRSSQDDGDTYEVVMACGSANQI